MGLRVLLIGAGHAHLHVVARSQVLTGAGVDLRLISPATFSYSGLATAALSRALTPAEGQINVAALAAAQGVRHYSTTVEAVDFAHRQVRLAAGGEVDFDVISFNIGSNVADPRNLRAATGVWPVKPLTALLMLKDEVETAIGASGRCPAIVVAGSGQTGFEVAAALCGLCECLGVRPRITVIGPTVDAAWAPARAARRLLRTLGARGVEFRADRVVARAPETCQLASGQSVACEALVLATGLVAADLMQMLSLPVDEDGRLQVSRTLRAVGDDRVFAVGDCSVIVEAPRPCVGVFGVRAAPILLHNLLALAKGKRLASYRPQRHWLSIMDLGDGTGLALRARIWWLGAAALQLKRWLDLGFIRKIRRTAMPLKRAA